MKNTLLSLLLFCGLYTFAQQDAWVYFTDKPNAGTYLANPLTMLTQRALDRRSAQGIALDMKDVPINQPYVDAVAAATGITVMSKSKWFNCVHVRGSQADINALLGLPFVSAVDFADDALDAQPRQAAHGSEQRSFRTSETWADYNYGTSSSQIQLVKGHTLHQAGHTGNGMVIAVLDAGFPGVDTAPAFQQIQQQGQILGGYNYLNDSTDFYTGGSHGTLVLSTMAGYVEGQLVGTAPDASYYLFMTEDATSENPVEESYWVEAAEEADRLGADIINTSLGYMFYDNIAYSHSYQDMDGATTFISKGAGIAASRGMLVVVAAGNSGAQAEPHIQAPADAIGILTVGAVASNGQIAGFSSIGPSFDGRVKPDVVAQGVSDVVANPEGALQNSNGTSFAAPVISGLAACLWQAYPDMTAAGIIQLIRESAHLYATPNAQYGYGIPDFSSALALAQDPVENTGIRFFPNPVHDLLQVRLGPEMRAEIRFYNLMGQHLRSDTISGFATLDVSAFPTGIYLYEVVGPGVRATGKIAKQ